MARKCPQCDSENTDTARFCSNFATPLQGGDEVYPILLNRIFYCDISLSAIAWGQDEVSKAGRISASRKKQISISVSAKNYI